MKYWQKMLDIWKPLSDDGDRLGYRAMQAGYEIGANDLAANVVQALEDQLANAKMKKKYRRGYAEATEMVYAVIEAFRDEINDTKPPYWTAQMSYNVHDDYSVVREWDSFGRNT